MALKLEPGDIDAEHSFLSDSSGGSSRGLPAQVDTATPVMTSPHPVNFLGDQVTSEVILDPMQDEVVYLPHRAPSGRVHRHRIQGVTEYANYTISHVEAEVNSKHLPKKYRCRFCIYKTSYKSDLNRHLRKHGVALQHCPLCNMPFKTAGNLENHIGQMHLDIAENMGILPSTLSTMCLKGAFASSVGMGVSPGMGNLHTGGHDLQGSHSDSGHDQQSLQLQKDFPVTLQVEHSPPQLHCHVCHFVSNDAQVLARHILTHPSEEEASRISQSSQNTVTKPSCNGCGMVLSSVGELHDHKHSCVNSEDSDQSDKKKAVQSPGNEKTNKVKRAEAGDKFGLPRQETMNKLRKIITHQNVGSDSQTSSSAVRPTLSGRKEKRSMILPHIPADEAGCSRADQKQKDSASHRPASHASQTGTMTGHGDESHVLVPANQQGLFTRSVNSRPGSCNEMGMSVLPADMTRLIAEDQGRATRSQPPQYSSHKLDDYLQSDRRSNERTWNSELCSPGFASAKLKQISKSVDCHSSNKSQANEQFRHNTVSVKEEPRSPDISMELEESDKSYKKDPKTCSGAARFDLVTNPASCTRSERECDLCGQFFRDRTHLIKHVQHVHIMTTEPDCSPARIRGNRSSSSHHKRSTTQATHNVPVLSPEHTRGVPKGQEHFHSSRSTSHDRDTRGQSPDTQLYNQRVVFQPPSQGRYALLVSSFDEFASKPYACSLCFFRTAHLSELSLHVHNHLTGGSTSPLPHSACFRSKEPFLVDRGTSPWKVDSEAALNFKPVSVSDSPISASDGNVTGVRSSNNQSITCQHSTAEHSEKRILSSFRETGDRIHTGDSSDLPSVSIRVGHSLASYNTCQHEHFNGSASSYREPCPQNRLSQTHEKIRPVATTAVVSDDDIALHLDKNDPCIDSKHPRTDCGDALVGRGETAQSDKTQKHPQCQNMGPTQSGLMHTMKSSLVQESTEHTHDAQKIPASSNVPVNIEGSPNSHTLPDNVNRTNAGNTSQTMQQSAKKSTNQNCRSARLHASQRIRQHRAKNENRVGVSKKSGVAKMGTWWSSMSPQNYRCEQCGQRFSVRQLLARHVRKSHPAINPDSTDS